MSATPDFYQDEWSAPDHQPIGPFRSIGYDQTWFHRVDWYNLVSNAAHAGMHPKEITSEKEYRFAQAIHTVVANNVAIDPLLRRPHRIINRERVELGLGEYYGFYPPTRQRTRAEEAARIHYQDQYLEEGHQHMQEFSEIAIMRGLQRTFQELELKHASRAAYGVLTAQGHALANVTQEETAAWRALPL